MALFLSAVGIYGVMAHAVSVRTREFGIRVALGAEEGDVRWLVLRLGVAIAAVGMFLGLAGTLAVTYFIRGLLFGVTFYDPETIATVAAFLMVVTLTACWIPAHRATHVDPIIALRYE
jgi:putative ABC transport system permease protein